jgi:hypothetical protein
VNVRRLYSTSRWQKTSRFVIARDRVCRVRAPGCTGRAETAHHLLPTSQYPEKFFDVRFIVGCCRRCNAHGGQVKSTNRANRMTISHLERVVEEREAEIEDLRAELARRDEAERTARHVVPRIA